MYCVVRCPFCKNLQGSFYPVKKTRCKKCSKLIDLQKTGNLGVFQGQDEMRSALMSLKLKMTVNHEEIEDLKMISHAGSRNKIKKNSRDALRRYILELLDVEKSTDSIIEFGIAKGYTREEIERALQDLMDNGLVYVPKERILKRA